jgi:hypothetical protein
MVEIEIGVLRSQCLDRRIESHARLAAEIVAWEHQRNKSGARINWMFSTEHARLKKGFVYHATECREKPFQATFQLLSVIRRGRLMSSLLALGAE